MLERFQAWVKANRTTIILTFEIFWVFVFLLDRVSNINAVEIPQFIYVNF